MNKRIISVPDAPKLPLSAAIKAGEFIFVSGQVGFEDPKTGAKIEGMEAQTRQCLEGMKQVLEAAGASLKDVVKVNAYIRSAGDFAKMNEVYQQYFPVDYPARTTVTPGFTMPPMLVEIDCVAYHPE
jgi:2-iminobutanoate/2-iminopropanoate deaminase